MQTKKVTLKGIKTSLSMNNTELVTYYYLEGLQFTDYSKVMLNFETPKAIRCLYTHDTSKLTC